MQPETSPKPRWRQHEFLLMTIATLMCIGGAVWRRIILSPQEIENGYQQPFREVGLHFDYLANVFLPTLWIVLVLYGCYCWLYVYILPDLWSYGKNKVGRYNRCILQLVALVLAQGLAWSVFMYYEDQYSYASDNINDAPRRAVVNGIQMAFVIVLVYLAITAIRELTLRFIEKDRAKRSFRTGMSNKISGFTVGYLTLPLFLFIFRVRTDDSFYIPYLTLIPPALLMGLYNVYFIFPKNDRRPLFRWRLLWQIFRMILLFTIPFTLFSGYGNNPQVSLAFSLLMVIVQLFVVTPVSWLIYQQRKDSILQVAGLERELGESNANLLFLRSQINPHFLFNALNTLYGTALQENAARSAEGIQKLGDMMRFMLHENTQDHIPMYKEIEYLRNYIALQQLRTDASAGISIHADIDEGQCHHSIAPMLLIPFVENAFKHGISLQEKSWIDIKLYCDEKSIIFEVRNSVHTRQKNDPEKDKSGIGLKNVLNRLRLLYPRQHQFFVNGDEKEFYVQLVIEPDAGV